MISRLTALLQEYPLSERLTEVLMRALHAAGDSAEALRCFARIRGRLIEELGTEQGRKLRALHELILKDGSGAASARIRRPVPETAPSVPGAAPSVPGAAPPVAASAPRIRQSAPHVPEATPSMQQSAPRSRKPPPCRWPKPPYQVPTPSRRVRTPPGRV